MMQQDSTMCIETDRGFPIWTGGGYFYPTDPRPEEVRLVVIAQGLSRAPRWGGHTLARWSVAEHSLLCLSIACRRGLSFACQRAVLMHDAAEAYIGDWPRPLKLAVPQYGEIERGILRAIGERFSIDFDDHAETVKEIDNLAAAIEKRDLLRDAPRWPGEPEPLGDFWCEVEGSIGLKPPRLEFLEACARLEIVERGL